MGETERADGQIYLKCFVMQYLSVSYHFLNKDKSYRTNLFSIESINDGLPFDSIEST
jgi:hypothetical protein